MENPSGTGGSHSHMWFGACAVVLALAIIGLGWSVYPRLKRNAAAIADLRNQQTAAAQVNNVPATVEPKAQSPDNAPQQQQLHDQFAKLERSMTARFERAHKQAHESAKDAFERARALVDMRMQTMQGRLAQLEAAHSSANSQVARLNSEIGQLRQQMAAQANEMRAVRGQLNRTATTETRQISDLKKIEERDRSEVDSVAGSLPTHRVDFEVTKQRSNEIAPGIYLRIDHSNSTFSNVDGWLNVMPEDRTFWLHRQNLQEPVIFYGAKGNSQEELVLTGIHGNSVTGYLLVPAEQGPGQIASTRAGQ